jgi:hypothetical protein
MSEWRVTVCNVYRIRRDISIHVYVQDQQWEQPDSNDDSREQHLDTGVNDNGRDIYLHIDKCTGCQ